MRIELVLAAKRGGQIRPAQPSQRPAHFGALRLSRPERRSAFRSRGKCSPEHTAELRQLEQPEMV